ncbi:MAG: iron ABC transporter permease [Eubacteriales bacterium]|nr:iron ABC transporter permease [Eubacteriales bacterium]
MKASEGFSPGQHLVFQLLVLIFIVAGIAMGSVMLPLVDTLDTLWALISGAALPQSSASAILVHVRIPRVLSAALIGAALSLCGAAMQGLLRNPLADGSTLGVSSGASLGAVIAISLGITVPALPFAGTVMMAMLFAFASLMLILALSYSFDRSFSTQTIILMGVIFSMFASSLISLIMAFSGDKLRSITFWTMGSLAGTTYVNVLILLLALVFFGGLITLHGRELNAFAVGEENALHIGVPVRRVKLTVMIAVSGLIGVCVSVGGTIGFVGLIIPHITRMALGPNHRKLLPASFYFGAIFLLLCDLIARTVVSPVELPIGVVTSLIGAMVFVFIFRGRKRKER